MGDGDLLMARQAYERRDWLAAYEALSRADATLLDADDFDRLAMAALLLGRANDGVQALQRAYRSHLDAADPLAAVRCAFRLAMTLTQRGEPAVGNGWRARAERLLDEVPGDVVERGYMHAHELYSRIHGGEFEEAWESAAAVVDYGRRFQDPDLLAMGLSCQGRLHLFAGQVMAGLRLLDEAMVGVAADELSPIFAGQVYCVMIEGCQQVSDFGRVAEWTAALSSWCAAQRDLVLFTGQCAVHRGQVLRFRGEYSEALREFELALQRYRLAETPGPLGLALAERGDVLRMRGDFAEAERSYQQAQAVGFEPQPGLALLWLGQGRVEAATAAVRRLLAERHDGVRRSQLLPGAIEVLIAHRDIDDARQLAEELETLANTFGCAALRAMAGYATGSVLVAAGEPAAALPRLRQAAQLWGELRAGYEVARCRALMGAACLELDDPDSATGELEAARLMFTELGALPALRDVSGESQAPVPGGLTEREVEVLRLVASGCSNAEIAATLVLSEKTVARHLSNIFAKLAVTSRTAAAAFAFENHLV